MFDTAQYEFEQWHGKIALCCNAIERATNSAERNRHWSELYQLSKKSSNFGLTVEDFNSIVREHLHDEEENA